MCKVGVFLREISLLLKISHPPSPHISMVTVGFLHTNVISRWENHSVFFLWNLTSIYKQADKVVYSHSKHSQEITGLKVTYSRNVHHLLFSSKPEGPKMAKLSNGFTSATAFLLLTVAVCSMLVTSTSGCSREDRRDLDRNIKSHTSFLIRG